MINGIMFLNRNKFFDAKACIFSKGKPFKNESFCNNGAITIILSEFCKSFNIFYDGNTVKLVAAKFIKSSEKFKTSKLFKNHRIKGSTLKNDEEIYNCYIDESISGNEILKKENEIAFGKVKITIKSDICRETNKLYPGIVYEDLQGFIRNEENLYFGSCLNAHIKGKRKKGQKFR